MTFVSKTFQDQGEFRRINPYEELLTNWFSFLDGKLKFSSAALPESYLNTGGGSGETFENFYAKTKDIEIDQNLIEKLRLAQQEIDREENKQTMERSLEESDYPNEPEDDLFADFSLRGSPFGKSGGGAEKLISEQTFDCYSCDSPDCTHPHISKGCSMCYTAHVRDTDGGLEKSKGCAATIAYAAMICSTKKYDGRHTHAEHGVSAQYAIECCEGKMCNNATDWPDLPEVPTDVEKEVLTASSEHTEQLQSKETSLLYRLKTKHVQKLRTPMYLETLVFFNSQ